MSMFGPATNLDLRHPRYAGYGGHLLAIRHLGEEFRAAHRPEETRDAEGHLIATSWVAK